MKGLDKITPKMIGEAAHYANVSQWIQMEIFKFMETNPGMRNSVDLADRIINRVLESRLKSKPSSEVKS